MVVTAGTFALAATVTDNMYPTANYKPVCFDGSRTSGTFCQTDNSSLTVYRGSSSLTDDNKHSIGLTLNDSYAGTDFTVTFQSSPVTTGSSETDIVYEKGPVAGGALGITWCNDAVSSTKCDQHYIRFSTGSGVAQGTACHETGHAVGLTHPTEASPRLGASDLRLGCMTNYVESKYLGSNNVSQINNTY